MNYIVFCDFDGTISNFDLIDVIVEKYIGTEYLIEMNKKLSLISAEHNEYLKNTFNNINASFDEIVNLLNNYGNHNVIDENFHMFYEWCLNNKIQFYIVSGGLKKLIKYYLPYIDEKLIYSNDIHIINKKCTMTFYNKKLNKDEIVKSLKKDKYTHIFIGDGTSDFQVINCVEILFAKNNSILEKKCKNDNINYIKYNNFKDIFNYFITNLVK
jgi:2-hydroxy-3-keto-5-methylthiopentenyl-1-phosphate phosphatase